MYSISKNSPLLALGAMIVGLSFFICGCDAPMGADGGTDVVEKKLPKMQFHKPKSFAAAVSRLDEIHKAVMSESDLPAPKKFKVVEIIHGTGASAHSHYHLAKEETPDFSHEEVHESSEKTHEVEVDIITEMSDLVLWLPKIAGDGDMEKESWEKVRSEAKTLWDEVNKQLTSTMSADEKRKTVQGLDSQISGFVTMMSGLVSDSAGDEQGSDSKGE